MSGNTNIFVVVVTQKPEIAALLCKLNGGERLSPLPGCYTGDDKSDLERGALRTGSSYSTLPLRPQAAQQDRAGRDGNGQCLSERRIGGGGIISCEPKVIAMGLQHSEEDLIMYIRIRVQVITLSYYRLAPCKSFGLRNGRDWPKY
jgi:hypothetical protein